MAISEHWSRYCLCATRLQAIDCFSCCWLDPGHNMTSLSFNELKRHCMKCVFFSQKYTHVNIKRLDKMQMTISSAFSTKIRIWFEFPTKGSFDKCLALITQTWCQSGHNLKCVWLTHWGQDKMAAISQTVVSNVFSFLKWKCMNFD